MAKRTGLTPTERKLRASLAAHELHAQYNSTQLTEPGRRAFLNRFLQQVDPEGALPEAERQRRAAHALQAHMKRLALASAKARRRSA